VLSLVGGTLRRRPYAVNDASLDVIDIEWKAYFLGLFMADGHLQGNRVTIKLQESDVAVLTRLRVLLGVTRPLRRDAKNWALYFVSEQIGKRLQDLGLSGRKTCRLSTIPRLSPDLMRHFVRGFFDGDGSVGHRSEREHQIIMGFCSTVRPFLVKLQAWLLTQDIVGQIYREKRRGKKIRNSRGEYVTTYKDMFRLLVTTHEANQKLIQLCWTDITLCISRKLTVLTVYCAAQNNQREMESFTYQRWEKIYVEYLSGAEVRKLAKKYGFGWRSLYRWMGRTGRKPRASLIGPSRGNSGEQSPLLAGNP
jgi:hypothetical protein